jgi:uncharacterized protein (TIGR02186 family)
MKTTISFLALMLLTAACITGGTAQKASANALVADLSKDQIRVASNFTGEKILLFGAIEGTGTGGASDVVVVVRGPSENFTLRRKKRMAGIWINAEARTLGPLPGYYAVASTRPLTDIAPVSERAKHQIGPEHLRFSLLDQTPEAAASPDTYSYSGSYSGSYTGPRDIALYHESFVRIKSGQNLYSVDPDGVRIIADRLFRAELTLPSGLPFGTYITEFFLFEKGRVVGYQTGELSVAITGLEQWLRVTAHDMPLLYGLFGVFIAGFMGWGVATLFRRV